MSTQVQITPDTAACPKQTGEIHGLRELLALSTRGLTQMLDPATGLFCHRLVTTQNGLRREGISPRYTAMTLLGLHQIEAAGRPAPLDVQSCYRSLIRHTTWIQGVGDLGLLLWVTAELDPDRTRDLIRDFDCSSALVRYSDARAARTMELAWFLTGLVCAARACPEQAGTLTDLCLATYRRMEKNQGQCGLFGHMGAAESPAGRLRGHIGSFADQVYPIFATSRLSALLQDPAPLGAALRCAHAICELQGSLGQWWWLYNSRTGRVASQYPVYSVHQHGMAPMALLAAEEVSGRSFTDSIATGLRWIYGENERGADMRDQENALIWRCLLPGRAAKYWQMAMRALNRQPTPTHNLAILHEQRPYEFGWLLFAFATKAYPAA